MARSRYKSFSDEGRCRFCRDKKKGGALPIDFKDVPTLQKLCTGQGKLYSRKRSGNCARHQRLLKLAAKRARFMGLIPYVGQ